MVRGAGDPKKLGHEARNAVSRLHHPVFGFTGGEIGEGIFCSERGFRDRKDDEPAFLYLKSMLIPDSVNKGQR